MKIYFFKTLYLTLIFVWCLFCF